MKQEILIIYILRSFFLIRLGFITLTVLFFIGCATTKSVPVEQTKPEPKVEISIEQPKFEPIPEIKVTPAMIDEYSKIHQISDPKKAEFYLTHPDYAKEHPYVPTPEDIALYEMPFLEKVYPDFKRLAEKRGFMTARSLYMNNPPAGAGSFQIGSRKYGAVMQKLASEAGQSAAGDADNPLLEADTATVNYNEGMKLYKEGRIDEAITHLEVAAQLKPDAPGVQYNLGVAYMDKGDTSKAILAFQATVTNIESTAYTKMNLRLYPDVYMGALTNLGMLYTRVGLYDQSVEALEKAIQFRPDEVEANRNLAITYYTMSNMDKAYEQMQKYVKLEPNNAEAHNNIGLILYNKGIYETAVEEFRTAKTLKPNEKQYAYNEGIALVKLGKNDEAVKAFKESSGFGEGEDIRESFIKEYEANRWRELYNQGHSMMEIGSTKKAIELFEQVLELKPNMLEAHVNLGFCYRQLGDNQKQIYHFEQALKLSPDSPEINYNLGLAYADYKLYQQAIDRFNKVIELKPDYKDAYFNLGTTLYKMNKFADAVKAFEKAVELSSNWLEARLNLGSSALKTGDIKFATIQFEEATKSNPKSADAFYYLGIAYMKDSRFNEASAAFQKAIDINPGHQMSRAMLKELEIYNQK
ncbi:MAG: Tetratricopeptide repeat protein [Candidatus Poribacteria bacterium]|nr:Tetratricopeptide repeat protein [Candidatus Poribacteria bacterium]